MAEGVAALDHKALDDAVEVGVIVIALAGEGDEVVNGVRGVGVIEGGLDVALIGGDEGVGEGDDVGDDGGAFLELGDEGLDLGGELGGGVVVLDRPRGWRGGGFR